MTRMIHTLLIANRGEIACRVIATARRMGIRTVAVFSDADAGSRHVALADAAFRIGPPPARDSYLNVPAILDAARRGGAQAVHPGYGFLSENAAFAEACAEAGIVFVGPPPAAIRAMGGKSDAKALMQQAGVPLVPGYHGQDQSPDVLRAAAEGIGWPLLIKASAGGGGKGMRVVRAADEFDAALAAARREALAAFGDDRVLLERYLTQARHIEIQVFADTHGNVVHLFERDCSVQRRHQKVIEEAPAPGLSAERRAAMGAAGVAAARAVGYVGAGTVEFIAEAGVGSIAEAGVGSIAEDGGFYFMEMNTRLQVEHPVTEMVTGLDLVEWQLRVAAGEPLPLAQADIRLRGHAIEARLYAEDPAREFLPSIGTLAHLRAPRETIDVRIDTGVRAGDAISPFYDPMIAKLIVRGDDRAEAVRRLAAALAGYEVAGVRTNLALLRAIAAHPAFGAGGVDTGFIAAHPDLLAPPADPPLAALAAAALAVLRGRQAQGDDPWAAADSWRMNLDGWQTLHLRDGLRMHAMRARWAGRDVTLRIGEATHELGLSDAAFTLDGERHAATVTRDGAHLSVILGGATHGFEELDPLAPPEAAAAGAGRVLSPIPGRVAAVLVAAGDTVAAGQALVVMEAMKMELTLTAAAPGKVAALRCAVGELVEEGRELVELDAADS